MNANKLNALQSLRGIAALLVCAFHYKDLLNTNSIKNLGNFLFINGSMGVPIFFIISGFIMIYTTKNVAGNIKDFRDFMIKRFIRIIPLYYLLTFFWILVGGSYRSYLEGDGLERLVYSLIFIPHNDYEPVLFLGWSLNYEMFFYTLFGISMLFGRFRKIVLILILSILVVTGFIVPFENAILKMIFSNLHFYFLVGIILGYVFDRIKISYSSAILIFILGVLFFLSIYLQNPLTKILWYNYFALTILVFGVLLLDIKKIKIHGFLIFLGNISFSIYLLHPFINIKLKKFTTDNLSINTILFVAEIIITIVLSKITYEFIEVKLTKYLKQRFINK